jgi:hypothetical protein
MKLLFNILLMDGTHTVEGQYHPSPRATMHSPPVDSEFEITDLDPDRELSRVERDEISEKADAEYQRIIDKPFLRRGTSMVRG